MDNMAHFYYHQWMDVMVVKCTLNHTPRVFDSTLIFQGPMCAIHLNDFIYDLNVDGYVDMDYDDESFTFYYGITEKEFQCLSSK